jgi:hypothetical protein
MCASVIETCGRPLPGFSWRECQAGGAMINVKLLGYLERSGFDGRVLLNWLASTCCLISLLASSPTFADSFSITLDTTSLSGTNAQLLFDLIDGDGISNNSLTVSNFYSDGLLASATSNGGVTGVLPSGVTINDREFFNEFAQTQILGKKLSFDVSLSNNFVGGSVPDGFGFFIFDSSGAASLTATNLLGDALLAADFSGQFAVNLIQASSSNPLVSIVVNTIAEPSSWLLILVGSVLIAAYRLNSVRQGKVE